MACAVSKVGSPLPPLAGSAARANARVRWPAPASGRGCPRSVGTGRKAGRRDRCGRSSPPASGSASPDAAPRAPRRRAWRNSCRCPACAIPHRHSKHTLTKSVRPHPDFGQFPPRWIFSDVSSQTSHLKFLGWRTRLTNTAAPSYLLCNWVRSKVASTCLFQASMSSEQANTL